MRPSPSLILSITALVLACAGSATAASVITSKQIRNGTITGADVKNRSIGSKDLKRGAVTRKALARRSVSTTALEPETVATMQATLATTRASKSELIGPGEWPTVSVACPEGQVALGGGGGWINPRNHLWASQPVLDAEGVSRGWQVSGANSNEYNYEDTLSVSVVCAP